MTTEEGGLSHDKKACLKKPCELGDLLDGEEAAGRLLARFLDAVDVGELHTPQSLAKSSRATFVGHLVVKSGDQYSGKRSP